MPESIFGMCIHGSIWIALKILENHQDKKVESCDIPYIQKLAMGSPYTDQEGLKFNKTARILRMFHSHAFYINNTHPTKKTKTITDENMIYNLYAYIESGLPVIIGVDTKDLSYWGGSHSEYHSIVAIGHTMNGGEVDNFIFHDESAYPYEKMSKDEVLKAWHRINNSPTREAVVVVPPEVSLPFESIPNQLERYVNQLSGFCKTDWSQLSGLHHRPMLLSADKFLTKVIFEQRSPLLTNVIFKNGFPEWCWIVYFYETKEDRMKEKDIGFFLRDATRKSDLRILNLKKEKTVFYQRNNKIFKTYLHGKKIDTEEIPTV